MNKNIKANFLRGLCFIASFISVFLLVTCLIAAAGRYYYYGNEKLDDVSDCRESNYVKKHVSRVVRTFIENVKSIDEQKPNGNDYKINVTDYTTKTTKKKNGNEIAEAENMDFLTAIKSVTSFGGYWGLDEVYHSAFMDDGSSIMAYPEMTGFIKISVDDYINLMNMYVPDYEELEYDSNRKEVLNKLNQYWELSETDKLYIQDSQNYFVYYGYLDTFSNYYMKTISLDNLKTYKYLYIPYDYIFAFGEPVNSENVDYYLEQDEVKRRILCAPYFDSELIAFFAALKYSDFEKFNDYLYLTSADYNYAYYAYLKNGKGTNTDGKNLTVSNIDMAKKELLDCKYDFYIEYDGKKVKCFYYDANGKQCEINALFDEDVSYIENEKNFQFLLGMVPIIAGYEESINGIDVDVMRLSFNFVKAIHEPVSLSIIFGIILFFSIIGLTILTGRVYDEDGNIKQVTFSSDRIYMEAMLVILGLVIVGPVLILRVFLKYLNGVNIQNDQWLLLFSFFMATGMIVSIILWIYISIVRRIKTKTFFNSWLFIKIIKAFVKMVKSLSLKLKGKKRVMIRLGLLFVLNVLAIAFASEAELKRDLIFSAVVVVFDLYVLIREIIYESQLSDVLNEFSKLDEGNLDVNIDTKKFTADAKAFGDGVNKIRDVLKSKVDISTRDEKLKAELITNVSHDIKTPLTSIISYIDLLKREETDNENIKKYIKILDDKSQRLKNLTLDLIEASKVSTGAISLDKQPLDLSEFLIQVCGEYEDKFEDAKLMLDIDIPETPVIIYADGRRLFRAMGNLFQNSYKYALSNSRVYIKLAKLGNMAVFTIKNISRDKLNISPDELKERFVRGDKSRYTEGSGLGLSISENIIRLHNGQLIITIDGDYFTARVVIPLMDESDIKSAEEKNDELLEAADEETEAANTEGKESTADPDEGEK